jgi:hypothetical protein
MSKRKQSFNPSSFHEAHAIEAHESTPMHWAGTPVALCNGCAVLCQGEIDTEIAGKSPTIR